MAFIPRNKDAILNLIYSWSGPLSYERLLKKIQSEFGLDKPPSRQSLNHYDEIKSAIQGKQEELRASKESAIQKARLSISNPDRLNELLEKYQDQSALARELIKLVSKLEDENAKLHSKNVQLEKICNNYKERFARWQHNLNRMDGVDLNQIDRGLPAKDRE
jgi:hypothetical protein